MVTVVREWPLVDFSTCERDGRNVSDDLGACCSFRDGSLGYACGGSGSLFKTSDGGDSWKRVRATDDVAGNLYAIKWQKNGAGYILGNDGILLRYIA